MLIPAQSFQIVFPVLICSGEKKKWGAKPEKINETLNTRGFCLFGLGFFLFPMRLAEGNRQLMAKQNYHFLPPVH